MSASGISYANINCSQGKIAPIVSSLEKCTDVWWGTHSTVWECNQLQGKCNQTFKLQNYSTLCHEVSFFEFDAHLKKSKVKWADVMKMCRDALVDWQLSRRKCMCSAQFHNAQLHNMHNVQFTITHSQCAIHNYKCTVCNAQSFKQTALNHNCICIRFETMHRCLCGDRNK